MRDDAVARAMAAIEAGRAKAESDPSRPRYHFRPPSRWMNDPNGPIYHDGWYHLFCQCNPYGDGWGTMHWGHARSRDLVRWEDLPIALAPATDMGEEHCYSGCAALVANGKPMLIYTSIGEREPEQWAAVSDDLLVWRRHPHSPLLTMASHGAVRVTQWRDPFVFTHDGRTLMLVGAKLLDGDGGNPACLIYESEDAELVRWRYRGVFFRHPNLAYPHLECPNICRLGGKWVLLCAFELRTVEYHVGAIDWNALTFTSEKSGTLDSDSLYATNLFAAPDGRTVLFGWVHGFRDDAGWNGCLSLPRELSIDSEDRLLQTPARELESLRGAHVALGPLTIENETKVLEAACGDRLEIALSVDVSRTRAFALELSSAAIRYQDGVLDIQGAVAPARGTLDLRVFLDGAVLEVYAQGGSACVTRVVYGLGCEPRLAITATEGTAIVSHLDVWRMVTP